MSPYSQIYVVYFIVKSGSIKNCRICVSFNVIVLSSGEGGGGGSTNTSQSEEFLETCGANFCMITNSGNENLERPPDSEIYEISSIYLCCVVIAVGIIAMFVDPLSR
jgi:hypothetical protein